MTQRLIGCAYPTTLPDSAFGAGQPCLSELGQYQAGRTRWIYEWLSGAQQGAEACAPVAPSTGELGHDHSGGLFGRQIQRTLWCTHLGLPTSLAYAELSNADAPYAVFQASDDDPVTGTIYDNDITGIWIPAAGGAASDNGHRMAQLHLLIHNSSATEAVTVKAQWHNFWRAHPEQSTTIAAATLSNWACTDYVNLRPHGLQQASLRVWAVANGTAMTVSLCAIALQQLRNGT